MHCGESETEAGLWRRQFDGLENGDNNGNGNNSGNNNNDGNGDNSGNNDNDGNGDNCENGIYSAALRLRLKADSFPLYLVASWIVRTFANRKKNTMIANYQDREEKLARFAKALGHPARIAILHFLAGRESCFFGDIHEVLPIAKATVSQHLSELKSAGLIQGEIQPPKVKYCIHRENWQQAKQLFADFFQGLDKCTAKGGGCCS